MDGMDGIKTWFKGLLSAVRAFNNFLFLSKPIINFKEKLATLPSP
jgi:hypothetical protein